MSELVIRRIRTAHCKRGPDRCEKCREAAAGRRICLLDVAPDDAGMVQRRVIEIVRGGESIWRELDVVRSFDDAAEARAYAAEHGVEDVEI